MRMTKLPRTDIQVSRLCLGSMTFGNPLAEKDAAALLNRAYDELGVNFIDTANMYEGYNRYAGSAGGAAEEIIGRAVEDRRGSFVIATKLGMKVGQAPEDENTSPEAIRVQLRKSLARLRTDYVDLYYLHRYDPVTPPEDIIEAIGEELRLGTVRCWGVSNYTGAQLRALVKAAQAGNIPLPSVCQPPLSLLNTAALDDVIPVCREYGIGVIPYQLLQGGLLTGKYKRNGVPPQGSRMSEKPEWMKPVSDEGWRIIEKAAEDASAAGLTMSQYAMRWALDQPGTVSALLGFKTWEQIAEASAAM